MSQAITFPLPFGNSHLPGTAWEVANPRAVLAIVHGHGEHARRYAGMASFLNQSDISVYAFDNLGHGQAPGKRGDMQTLEQMQAAVDTFVKKVKEEAGEVPVFLLGHSLGGNLVANYVLKVQPAFAGVVLSAPWLRLAIQPSAGQMLMARIGRLLAPGLTIPTKLNPEFISRIPEEVKRYQDDPDVHDLMSPRIFFSVIDAGEWAIAHASEWDLPLLAYHGTGDQVTDHEATAEFVRNIDRADATFVALDGAHHEPHHDIGADQVLTHLRDWLLSHVAL